MVDVSSWGRLGQWKHDLVALSDRHQVAGAIRASTPGLAYGMGRSYGDVCLNPEGALWKTTGLDKFIAFDEQSGRIRCEAGVLLRDIQRLAIPRGWMLPVTPGTQFVTVGGAIANDVHGKNHHVFGTFGEHIRHITLLRTDGTIIECGPDQEPEWFAATVGGLGLTGFILTAEITLRRVAGAWVDTETVPFGSLDEFFMLAGESETKWEYTVSWIDCMARGDSRGIFMRANHASSRDCSEPAGKKMAVPCVPPVSLVNRLSLRPFNTAYFNSKKRQAGPAVMHYQPFFYPLDNLLEWNRMYGPKGFYQYQSVVPNRDGKEAVQEMLREIAHAGEGSFLAVLKTFGSRPPPGMLSFAMPGVTLALDFPNMGDRILKLFERLDAVVKNAGGRLYPAKDARMPRSLFEAGYPALARFLPFRDPGISSAMSRRLIGQ